MECNEIGILIADQHRSFLHRSLVDFREWKAKSFERLFRVTAILGFLIADLSRSGQNVWWFKDEDEIVANEERLQAATKLLGGISGSFLSHQLGSLQCGTNVLYPETELIKDLTSIADLGGGALGKAWDKNAKDGTLPTSQTVTSSSIRIVPKAQEILRWLARTDKPLKRLVCVLNHPPDKSSSELNFSWVNLHLIQQGRWP